MVLTTPAVGSNHSKELYPIQPEKEGVFNRVRSGARRAKITAGTVVGATAVVVVGPALAEESLKEVGVEVNVPGANNVANAGDCLAYDYSVDPPKCILEAPSSTQPPSTSAPGGGGGGGGGGSSPTTIPWSNLDDDRDGTPNGFDVCQGTVAGEVVDGNGCSANQRDDDKDYLIGGVEVFIGTDPNNPDTDRDGRSDGEEVLDADGKIKAVLDTDGDGVIDALESGIDTDGDGLSPETGDTQEGNPCIPDDQVSVCDGDGDGLFGSDDKNPDVPFRDIDGDGIDDSASVENGGDGDLTDGPLADIDGDGVLNRDDMQNIAPKSGERVDENGVIVASPTHSSTGSTIVDEVTLPVANSQVNNSAETDTSAVRVVGLSILGATAIGGVFVFVIRRRSDKGSVASRPA